MGEADRRLPPAGQRNLPHHAAHGGGVRGGDAEREENGSVDVPPRRVREKHPRDVEGVLPVERRGALEKLRRLGLPSIREEEPRGDPAVDRRNERVGSGHPEEDLHGAVGVTRRGEALSLLVDEEPTFGHFPMVYYYQGRARDGLKNAAAAASYGEYLKIRGQSTEDRLLPDVRRRAGK